MLPIVCVDFGGRVLKLEPHALRVIAPKMLSSSQQYVHNSISLPQLWRQIGNPDSSHMYSAIHKMATILSC